MKKVLSYLAFFFFGIGFSYFFANHKIIENKNKFVNEVELLNEQYKSKQLSFNELKKQNQELNGKLFQLLFAYFGIDLREMNFGQINDSSEIDKEGAKEVIKEKIVYIEKEPAPVPDTKKDKKSKKEWSGDVDSIVVSDYLKEATPVNVKSLEFEMLKRKHNKFIALLVGEGVSELSIDLDYIIKNRTYVGEFRVRYHKIDPKKDSSTTIGTPTNFITNSSYPGIIGVWIYTDKISLINTASNFKLRKSRGLIYKKTRNGKFKKEAFLKEKLRL
jgi:hypothetical protein